MEKVAGPYMHTLTGPLGDKRSTMLENELQYKVGIGNIARHCHSYDYIH